MISYRNDCLLYSVLEDGEYLDSIPSCELLIVVYSAPFRVNLDGLEVYLIRLCKLYPGTPIVCVRSEYGVVPALNRLLVISSSSRMFLVKYGYEVNGLQLPECPFIEHDGGLLIDSVMVKGTGGFVPEGICGLLPYSLSEEFEVSSLSLEVQDVIYGESDDFGEDAGVPSSSDKYSKSGSLVRTSDKLSIESTSGLLQEEVQVSESDGVS